MDLIKDKRGDIGVSVLIKVVVFFMLFSTLISIIPVFFYAHNVNQAADKILRAAELSGSVGSVQVGALTSEIRSNLPYTITTNWTGTTYYISAPKVNLGDKISLKLTGTYKWKTPFGLTFDIPISAKAVGSSEVFYND